MNRPSVRLARRDDAAEAVSLLAASITALCAADHRNDRATLERWLGNKTVAEFERWLADARNFIVIAELGTKLCGVALLHESGHIRLCYVLPGVQREGVGRALIDALEVEAHCRGLRELQLMSTGNARRFYERLGFTAKGDASVAFGVLQQYPYVKLL